MAVRIDVRMLGRPHVVVDDVVSPIVGRQLLLTLRLAVRRVTRPDHTRPARRRCVDGWHRHRGRGTRRADTTAQRARSRRNRPRAERVHAGAGGRRSTPSGSNNSSFVAATGRSRSGPVCASSTRRWRNGEVGRSTTSNRWPGSTPRPSASTSSTSRRSISDSSCDSSTTSRLRWSPNCAPRSICFPARERRAEMLALALYRSGRQSDALDVDHPDARASSATGTGWRCRRRCRSSRCGSCGRIRICSWRRAPESRRRSGRRCATPRRGGPGPHRRLRRGAHDPRRHDDRGPCRWRSAHVGARPARTGPGTVDVGRRRSTLADRSGPGDRPRYGRR